MGGVFWVVGRCVFEAGLVGVFWAAARMDGMLAGV